MLILRSLLAFLALPVVVAGVVPWAIARGSGELRARPLALVLGAGGVLLLATCAFGFAARGRGTLAPWDPPRRLVVRGPYARVRNPMYLGVLAILVAWALASRTAWSWVWAVTLTATFHARVVRWEEPWLAEAFGAEWEAYRRTVPRWLPRLRATEDGA